MKKLILIALATLSGSVMAQSVNVPIVLTQRLPWAPATIVVGNSCNIEVVLDTADYVAIITSGSVALADSIKFPTGKITLDEATKRLTIDNSISIKDGIKVYTSSKDVTIKASQNSSVVLRSATDGKARLSHLVLNSDDMAMINVKVPVEADEAVIDARDYSWIRYGEIDARQKNTDIRGGARVVEVGEERSRVEDSPYGELFLRDHQQVPVFLEYSFGISTLGSSPFHSSYIKGDNYIWSAASLSQYVIQFRYAFWTTNHWSLSAGFGMDGEGYRADNSYLGLAFDSLSSLYSIEAQNSSTLFADEEAQNGKTYWNSSIGNVFYLTLPIRIEWRSRADYKGIRLGAELRPSIAIFRKEVTLRHNGFYADRNMVAGTYDSKIGKLVNPFRLDACLTAGHGRFGVYALSSLTPVFRSKTDNPGSKPALNHRLFSSSLGITFTF